MGAEKPELPGKIFRKALIVSMLAGVFLVVIPYFICMSMSASSQMPLFLNYSFAVMLILPLVQGATAAYQASPYHAGAGGYIWLIMAIFLIDFAIGALVFQEGVICMFMAAPFYLGVITIGALIGRSIYSVRIGRNKTLKMSLMPLIVLAVVFDTVGGPPDINNAVTDAVTVNATPEQVWKYIVQYPENTNPSNYWLWDLGLPMPINSVASAKEVGASRECRFTNGIKFDEEIIQLEPNKVMTFKVTAQPKHPEIVGHFSLDKGQMYLVRNPNGTTTIVATSWYQLHVRPSGYFDLWAADIVRNVHFRVLNQIKQLAEKDAKANKQQALAN